MKLFKSVFSKFHFPFMAFGILNIVLGLALYYSVPYFGTVGYVHFFAGILIFLVPLVMFISYKDKPKLYATFKARIIINENDRKHKKIMVIFSKVMAWIFIVSLFIAMLDGVIIKTGVLPIPISTILLFRFHMKLVFVIPLFLILHIVTMKLSKNIKPNKKPDSKINN